MSAWRCLEKDFRDIPDNFGDLRADWSDQPGIRNHWRLAGGSSRGARDRFTAIAALAGKQLLACAGARRRVPEEALEETDPLTRWLSAVRDVTGHFETGPYGVLQDAGGQNAGLLFTGSIPRVIEASALLCLLLAAEDISSTDLRTGQLRLFVDDIDSFVAVRQVNPREVLAVLSKGRVEVAEDEIQRSLEEILGVPLHKKDWGGEENDLYTTNVIVGGRRVPTAFVLKGRGEATTTLQIAHCGHNGDQIVRLFQSPADLFVLQFVGMISESIVKDMEGKTSALLSNGHAARFCTIDGQDTARLLRSVGKL